MQYFMMSLRFHKSGANAFGLVETETPDIFLLPADQSRWLRRDLYDLGWGPENGFCRVPIPDFSQLFDMVLYDSDRENRFGAAAILLEDHPLALLKRCRSLVQAPHPERYREAFVILKLDFPVRYSQAPVERCTPEEYARWLTIAQTVMPFLPAKRTLPY